MTDEELCIHIEDIIQKHTRRHDDTPLDAAQEIVLGFKQAGLLIPPGWVAVPEEATEEMKAAGHDHLGVTPSACNPRTANHVYLAMLTARPKGEGK